MSALGFSSKNAISFARLSKFCIAFFARAWSFGENSLAAVVRRECLSAWGRKTTRSMSGYEKVWINNGTN
jgi:hypothetical protein